ncbi:GFA family protein [Henriciella sp.]|uniref:GFA family protein n=1 Tax=Henriciella sp. TaxID=1968823 RepID=UPI002633E5AD|nr:GFA family protein [Henriciella sp.]
MKDPDLPLDGSCRCGSVRFRVTAPPLATMACHCTGCQKMSASAFSASAAFPADGFELLAGDPVIGGLKGETRHYFCQDCMTWLYTRPEGVDFMVNIRATMLDDTSWFAPFMETYLSEKLDWAETGAPHGFEQFPTMDDIERLTPAFNTAMGRSG